LKRSPKFPTQKPWTPIRGFNFPDQSGSQASVFTQPEAMESPPPPTPSPAPSSILPFFKDKSIFLTGATGLLGKVVLEKILRDLPEVRQIFVLVRADPKKNTQPKKRLAKDILGTVC
jgi:hypothetical protein